MHLDMPAYIHLDSRADFMSADQKNRLNEKSIATSRTIPYNPEGNGQAERYNGILLEISDNGIKMAKNWEHVLPDVFAFYQNITL